jgi:hypothetical protein
MTRDNESNPSSHPPPPCDPFQRYQSYWPRQQRDDDPFIRFRRFADQQFKSFFDSFGLVRSNSDENERVSAPFPRDMNATRIDVREHEHDILDILARAQEDCQKEDQQRTPDTELDMYQDKDRLRSQNVWHLPPDQLDPFIDGSHLRPWLQQSPYSPLFLQYGYHTSNQFRGPKEPDWVDAFEDLAERGHVEALHEAPALGAFLRGWMEYENYWNGWQGRLAEKSADQHQRRQAVLRLPGEVIEQGSDTVGDSSANSSNEAVHGGADIPQTHPTFAGNIAQAIRSVREVFGDDAISRDQAERVIQASQGSMAASDPAATMSSIVETMIRTETQTTSEGLIETRRVLRRRFSDGREENEETLEYSPVHKDVPEWLKTHLAAATYPTVDKQTQTRIQDAVNDTKETETVKPETPQKQDKQESRGGWFWR